MAVPPAMTAPGCVDVGTRVEEGVQCGEIPTAGSPVQWRLGVFAEAGPVAIRAGSYQGLDDDGEI